jgi:transcriptional regulator with XRE-family HTH domain
MAEEHSQLGRRIRMERRCAGLTQQQLGERIGLTRCPAQRIGQWESGYRVPDPSRLEQIEQALGLTEGTLAALREPDQS